MDTLKQHLEKFQLPEELALYGHFKYTRIALFIRMPQLVKTDMSRVCAPRL